MGNLLSKLTIGRLIGQGHFGKVYEGNDPVHGKVAVKQIGRKVKDTDDLWDARKEGAQLEAQHLKKASHRNVVNVHHYCEDEAGALILYVMEFCEGGSLQTPYEKGPLPIDEVRSIATDLTAGLAALHANSLLHRDIKPANLLRDARGVTKLGDFGLVTDRLVLGYGSAGDYAYSDHISPEVWNGSPTSPRSDIWATGMTLFRLLHGQRWHQQYSPPGTKVAKGGYAAKLRWLPHVPSDWRRVIRRMLRDDPADRYRSTSEVERGIAALTVHPSWRCEVLVDRIQWFREKRDRRIVVTWDRSDLMKTSWMASSEPSGVSGVKRRLGGSSRPLNDKAAHRELQDFFKAQT